MQRVVDWLASNFKKDEGIDLLKDKQALQRLTEAAEKAKIELSSLTQTNMRYGYFLSPSFFFAYVHFHKHVVSDWYEFYAQSAIYHSHS